MTEPPNKIQQMAQAASLVPSGARLAFGGVTLYRRPMAFALALLARHTQSGAPEDLCLQSFTSGLESDLLVAAGMVRQVRTCYFGLEAFGLAPHFTLAAERGWIEIREETEASIVFGLRATLAGVGFMPSKAWLGTDLLRLRPDVKRVHDPYSGEELVAFPAIDVDVAVLHALEADSAGNAVLGGNLGIDEELALVAETVIVTAERIVPRLERADIVGLSVDAVVEAPGGAWPTSCHPDYPLDGRAVLEYLDASSADQVDQLVRGWTDRQAPA